MSINTTVLKIRLWPDKILRKKSIPVKYIGQEEKKIFEEMAYLMYAAKAIGLSGPQVGMNRQMIVVDVGQGPLCLANPKILKRQGKSIFEEGCLSIPGICIKIKRPEKIEVRAFDQDNKNIQIEVDGLLARALQHEIDHLSGKLIIDYASFRQRFMIKSKLSELKKRAKDGRLSEQIQKSCKLSM